MPNFADYHLADLRIPATVLELGDGVLPEMAVAFDVSLDPDNLVDSLGELVGKAGKAKTLEDNIVGVQEVLGTDANALAIAADWVERAGIQQALNRSLWTPDLQTPNAVDQKFMPSNVAGWSDRAVLVALEHARATGDTGQLHILSGNRVMAQPTEDTHAKVVEWEAAHGVRPTETDYMRDIAKPLLTNAGYDVKLHSYDTGAAKEIMAQFAREHPEAFTGSALVFRNANGGIQTAVELVRAARAAGISFDMENAPQLFIATDNFPVARTAEENANPAEYQRPYTALRQIPLTAKFLLQVVSA